MRCAGRGIAAVPAARSRRETRGPRRRVSAAPLRARARSAEEDAEQQKGPGQQRRAGGHQTSPADVGEGDAASLDVYGHAPLLESGMRKHTFSVFVGDETGMINKVSSVFSRRGFNIESLAVGLNGRKALFTVVALVDRSQAIQLVRQLLKLVKVERVADITGCQLLERELELVKVRAPAGSPRTEVLELAGVYRAGVVDISETTVTLSVAGDRGKISSLERMLSKFGIVQLARAGKVSLKRGSALDEQDWARFREEGRAGAAAGGSSSHKPKSEASPAVAAPEADVYPDREGPKVWEVSTFPVHGEVDEDADALHERWGLSNAPETSDAGPMDAIVESTLSILVENLPGVLSVVTGVFTQRGYNIQSLAVGPAESRGTSRITMVVPGTHNSILNLAKQLEKKPNVIQVTNMTEAPFAERELMLVRVGCSPAQRQELVDLATIFRGRVADICPRTLTIELMGDKQKMAALQSLMRPYGILEVARTGRVGLPRESGVDTALLQKFQTHTSLY